MKKYYTLERYKDADIFFFNNEIRSKSKTELQEIAKSLPLPIGKAVRVRVNENNQYITSKKIKYFQDYIVKWHSNIRNLTEETLSERPPGAVRVLSEMQPQKYTSLSPEVSCDDIYCLTYSQYFLFLAHLMPKLLGLILLGTVLSALAMGVVILSSTFVMSCFYSLGVMGSLWTVIYSVATLELVLPMDIEFKISGIFLLIAASLQLSELNIVFSMALFHGLGMMSAVVLPVILGLSLCMGAYVACKCLEEDPPREYLTHTFEKANLPPFQFHSSIFSGKVTFEEREEDDIYENHLVR